jgi:hypothetical protein
MGIETPQITLENGAKMPQVGFGLWKVDNDTCADTVYNAIKTGYRLFDGACGTLHTAFVHGGAVAALSHPLHSRVNESRCLKTSAPN